MGFLSKLFGGGDEPEEAAQEENDEAAGSEAPEEPVGEAEEIPPSQLWATVLFPYPLEYGLGDVESLLEEAGLPAGDLEQTGRGGFRATLGGQTLRLRQRDEPFPAEATERRMLPEGFPDDYAYLAVAPESDDPLAKRDLLRTAEEYPDPWAEEGIMRVVTKLVRAALERDGLAVVLNRAAQLVVPNQQFVEMTGGADDPDRRPFLPWIDVDYDDDEEFLRTEGLRLFGLPEISVHFDHDDGNWRLQREQEALGYVASKMVHANEPLGVDADAEGFLGVGSLEALEVPLGAEVDDTPVEADDDADLTRFEAEMREERLVLTGGEPGTVWESWASLEDPEADISPESYRALFRHACREVVGSPPLGSILVDDFDEMETFHCDLYQSENSQMVTIVTNGLGRSPVPAGDDAEEPRRIELAVRTGQESEQLVDVLTNCAAGITLSGDSWDPGDTVEFEEPLHGLQHFVLNPLFDVSPADGPAVAVWQIEPVEDE